jgi:NHL repeat
VSKLISLSMHENITAKSMCTRISRLAVNSIYLASMKIFSWKRGGEPKYLHSDVATTTPIITLNRNDDKSLNIMKPQSWLSVVLLISFFARSLGISSLDRVAGACVLDDPFAMNVCFGCISGISVDSKRNLYLTDKCLNKVRFITSSTGALNSFGSGYPFESSSSFNQPTGIFALKSNLSIVTDSIGKSIRIVNVSSGDIFTVATNQSLNAPSQVTVDVFGNLYLIEPQLRQVFTANISSFITNPITSSSVLTTNFQQFYSSLGDVGVMSGIAIDPLLNVIIVDQTNNKLVMLNKSSSISGIIYQLPYTNRINAFNHPSGVCYDKSKNMYVTDSSNNQIVLINTTSWNVSSVIKNLGSPSAIAADGNNNIYYSEDSFGTVTKYNVVTKASTVMGGISVQTARGYDGDGLDAGSSVLNWPNGLAVDSVSDPSTSYLYIADSYNFGIRYIDKSTNIIDWAFGSGDLNISTRGVDGLDAGIVSMAPVGIAVDRLGNVLYLDSLSSRVRMVNLSTNIVTTIAGNASVGYFFSIDTPSGIVISNDDDNVFFTSQHSVYRVNIYSKSVKRIVGTTIPGFNGDNLPGTSCQLNAPMGLALTDDGNVIIADSKNNRIRVWDKVSTNVTTLIGSGNITGFTTISNGKNASLSAPSSVAFDYFKNLYVGDAGNHAIRVYSNENRTLSTLITNLQSYTISSLAIDTIDNALYYSDNFFSSVYMVQLQAPPSPSATPSASSSASASASASISGSVSASVTPSQSLIIKPSASATHGNISQWKSASSSNMDVNIAIGVIFGFVFIIFILLFLCLCCSRESKMQNQGTSAVYLHSNPMNRAAMMTKRTHSKVNLVLEK